MIYYSIRRDRALQSPARRLIASPIFGLGASIILPGVPKGNSRRLTLVAGPGKETSFSIFGKQEHRNTMADAGPAIYSQTQPVPLDLFSHTRYVYHCVCMYVYSHRANVTLYVKAEAGADASALGHQLCSVRVRPLFPSLVGPGPGAKDEPDAAAFFFQFPPNDPDADRARSDASIKTTARSHAVRTEPRRENAERRTARGWSTATSVLADLADVYTVVDSNGSIV